MPSIQFLSTTIVETWAGADMSQIGPIYPMVGSEFILFIIGLVFWLGFHFSQAGIENKEMQADEEAAKNPERLKRVFAKEAEHY
jgi:hypothetical protein